MYSSVVYWCEKWKQSWEDQLQHSVGKSRPLVTTLWWFYCTVAHDVLYQMPSSLLFLCSFPSSAVTLLVGQQDGYLACKSLLHWSPEDSVFGTWPPRGLMPGKKVGLKSWLCVCSSAVCSWTWQRETNTTSTVCYRNVPPTCRRLLRTHGWALLLTTILGIYVYIRWSDVPCLGCSTIAILWGNTVVLCVVKWWRFVALFEWNWISWFKKMSVLSPSY